MHAQKYIKGILSAAVFECWSQLVNYHSLACRSFSTYNFEEVVQCVAVEFEIQFLRDDKFHPVHITSRELAVVVLHHGYQNDVHRLDKRGRGNVIRPVATHSNISVPTL